MLTSFFNQFTNLGWKLIKFIIRRCNDEFFSASHKGKKLMQNLAVKFMKLLKEPEIVIFFTFFFSSFNFSLQFTSLITIRSFNNIVNQHFHFKFSGRLTYFTINFMNIE